MNDRRHSTGKYRGIALSVLFCFVACLTAAGDTEPKKGKKLEEMNIEELLQVDFVSASLRHQKAVEAPSKVVVIGRDKIQARNYRYLADLLADLPGVRLSLFSASPDSGSSQLIARGISGNNKIVLMWNGQRLNHPDAQALHIHNNLYPLFGIDRVEVVYGPASALYGSDTISMTVNMITGEGAPPGKKARIEAGLDYGRFNEIMWYALYKNTNGPVKSDILINYFHTGGIDFSFDEEYYGRYPTAPGLGADFTAYDPELREPHYNPVESSLTGRLRFRLGGLALQAYYQRFQTQTQLGWSPILYEADKSSGHYIFEQMGFHLKHKYRITLSLTLESSIEHTHARLDPDSHWNRPNMEPFREYSSALVPRGKGTRTYKLNYGNRTKLEEKLNWDIISGRLNVILGASFTTADMMPKTANLDGALNYNDSFSSQIEDTRKFHVLTERNLGFFLQFQYRLSSRFSLTAGTRFDSHDRYGETLNPRLVLNYFDGDGGFYAKVMAGSGFLAPAAFYAYDTFLVPRHSVHVPNPELEPEESRTYEINLGKTFSNTMVELSLFYTHIDNLIVQKQEKSVEWLTDELGTYQFTTYHSINSGKTSIWGGTLEWMGKFSDHVMAQACYTYVSGETRDYGNGGEPYDLIHVPNHMGKVALDISPLKSGALNIYVSGVFMGEARYHPDNYRFPAVENGGESFTMPSYWLMNISAGYSVTRNLSLRFSLSNVFDKRYEMPIVGQETSNWTRVAYTPGLPRMFSVGLRWQSGD